MCICEVLTHRTLTLFDSRILDMTHGIETCYAINLSNQNDDTMTQSDNPDSSKVCFDRVYRPRMLRGMDVFHPMLL